MKLGLDRPPCDRGSGKASAQIPLASELGSWPWGVFPPRMGVRLRPQLAFTLSPDPWADNLVDVQGGSVNNSILWPPECQPGFEVLPVPDSHNINPQQVP